MENPFKSNGLVSRLLQLARPACVCVKPQCCRAPLDISKLRASFSAGFCKSCHRNGNCWRWAGQHRQPTKDVHTPRKTWSDKRERQCQHILDSERIQGKNVGISKKIAARTVNKVRAQQGEAQHASCTSTKDLAPSKRGGQHSHSGAQGRTKAQLCAEARRKNIAGCSKMDKNALERALQR